MQRGPPLVSCRGGGTEKTELSLSQGPAEGTEARTRASIIEEVEVKNIIMLGGASRAVINKGGVAHLASDQSER